ncbi:MAG: DinB family protein [Ktedonobacteraceae bacterium]
MMDKTVFISTLKKAREEWEALLAQVGEEQMLQPGAAGKWSVKDVIAHVTWGEREVAPVMRAHVLAGSELWNLSDDERNEIVYQQNRDRSLHEIMNEEQQAYADLLAAAQTLSDEDLNDSHRYKQMPEEWVPWQLYAGNTFKHYQDHMPSIREWLAQRG